MSHWEAYLKGCGSSHGDDNDWLKKFGTNMDEERAKVKKLIKEMKAKKDKKDDDVKTVTKVDKDKTNPTPPVKVTSSKRSKKEVVKALQTALNKDYGCGLSVDGDYGAKSEAAVKKNNIKKGSKSNSVKWIQTVCNELGYKDSDGKKLSVDGDWGSRTTFAVKSLQKRLGVSQDAIVGTGTMSKLLKKYK